MPHSYVSGNVLAECKTNLRSVLQICKVGDTVVPPCLSLRRFAEYPVQDTSQPLFAIDPKVDPGVLIG